MRFFARSLLGLFLLAITLGILAMAGLTMVNAVKAGWPTAGRACHSGNGCSRPG